MELIAEIEDLNSELQKELRQFLLVLADTKRALGIRYAEWCDRAPTLEAGVAASAMAQDQLGQARVFYALIQEFPDAPTNLDDETRPHRSNLAFLDHPFPHWGTFVAANLLVGAAVTITEESLAGSRFVALRTRMPKMLDEERFHRVHAEGWFKFLSESAGSQEEAMWAAISEILPEVLCWFGDAQHNSLSSEMIVTMGPREQRAEYLMRFGPALEATGLVEFRDATGAWSYTDSLPWDEFDPVTRRVRGTVAAQ